MTESENKISFKEKLFYGFGYLGMGLEYAFTLAYLTFFATDVLYIKASIIGIVILLPKLLDVVTDIIIVNAIDKTDTRFGKYKPWILSGIPLSCCLYLLFCKPSFLTTSTQNLLWITVIYFIMVPFFETMFWCPYLTMGTVISSNDGDRIDLASIRSVFEDLSSLIVVASCLPLVNLIGEDYHDPLGWRIIALIYGIIGIIFTLVCFFGVKERVKVNNYNQNGQVLKLSEKLAVLKHNRPFIKVVVLITALYLPWYAYSTLFNYFCIYVLGHSDWIASLSIIGVIISTFASILASRLGHKLESRKIIALGASLLISSSLVFALAKGYLSMVFFFLLKDTGIILIYVPVLAYLPGLADYAKKQSGLDVTGIINAVFSTAGKLVCAFAAFLATIILTISKYDATLTTQTIYTQGILRWSVVILFIVFGALILLINNSLRELDQK